MAQIELQGSGVAASTGGGVLSFNAPLAGSGVASGLGDGTLTVGVGLTGSGVAASAGDVVLSFNVPLSGAGEAVATGDGVLSLNVPLSGAGEAVATGDGFLSFNVPLVGSGVARALGSGLATRLRSIEGSAVASSSGTGLIDRIRSLFGEGKGTALGSGVVGEAQIQRSSVVATVDHTEVSSDLTNSPVYVDLADLPQTVLGRLSPTGEDIEVRDAGLNLLPRELLNLNTVYTGPFTFNSSSAFGVKTNYSYSGSRSIGIENSGTAPNLGAEVTPNELSGGEQIDSFKFYYRETSNSTGGGLRFVDSNGTVILAAYTDNPEWDVYDADGTTEVDGGPSASDYSLWIEVEVVFDWGAGTAEVTWTDPNNTSDTASYTATLRSITDVEKLTLNNYNGGDQNYTGSWVMWFDDISFTVGGETTLYDHEARKIVGGDLHFEAPNISSTNDTEFYVGKSPTETAFTSVGSPSNDTTYYTIADPFVPLGGSGGARSDGTGRLRRTTETRGRGVATSESDSFLSRTTKVVGSAQGTATGSGVVSRPILFGGSGVARGLAEGNLEYSVIFEGTGAAEALGEGVFDYNVIIDGSGEGVATGDVHLSRTTPFSAIGSGRAIGTGALGDIVAHWLTVDGATESTDAGSSASLSALDADKVHVFQVQALDSAYNFSGASTVSVSPITLDRTSVSDDFQTLKVKTADGSFYDSIELYRKKTQGGSWSLYHRFSDPSESQTFTDVALNAGTTYYYEARGVGAPSGVDVESKARGFQTSPVVELSVDSSKIDSDISGYPVYVDLSVMPASFWAGVSGDGGGIRVTDALGNPLPREIVRIDSENQEGEMHFKGDVSSASDTTFIIKLTGKSDPAPTDPEGRNAVWSNYEAVWHLDENPDGASAAIDSTGNGHDASFNGGLDETDRAESPLGGGVLLEDDQYLAPAGPDLKGQRDGLQFETWFRTGSDGIIASWDRNEQFRMEVGGSRSGGDLGTSYQYDNSSTDDNLNDTSTNATDDNWHHSVFRYDQGDAKQVTDGAVQSDRSQGSEIGTNTSRYGFFGSGSEATSPDGSKGPTNWWNGGLDEARLATQALSMAQVKAAYRNQANPGSFFSVGTASTTQLSIARSASTKTSMTIEVAVENPSFFSEVRLLAADSQGGSYSVVATYPDPSAAQTHEDTGLSEGDTRYYKAEADVKIRNETLSATSSFTLVLLPDSITFDNQGSTGITGPDSISYSWESEYDKLSTEVYGNGKQVFQVPAGEGGTYRIEALGAEGGRDADGNGEPGGAGARIEGEFDLNGGDILHILVGQRGTDGDGLGGGGGATHVAKYDPDTGTYTELISAGGGAGGGYYAGGDGEAQLSNDDSGGNDCSGSAGFRGNSTVDQLSERAKSFVNGGVGSQGDKGGGDGGFGGGAGSESDSGGLNSQDDFGPGGGYQGRDGPCNQAVPGGYSYNDGANQNNVAGENAGHGEVKLILPKGL